MGQVIAFWIVFGVAAFGWALALQMRMMVVRVLSMSVAAKYPQLHPGDVRNVVRASPLAEPPEELSGELGQVHIWLRGQHPGAIGHLALARRWSMVLPVIVLVIVVVGRFGLRVI